MYATEQICFMLPISQKDLLCGKQAFKTGAYTNYWTPNVCIEIWKPERTFAKVFHILQSLSAARKETSRPYAFTKGLCKNVCAKRFYIRSIQNLCYMITAQANKAKVLSFRKIGWLSTCSSISKGLAIVVIFCWLILRDILKISIMMCLNHFTEKFLRINNYCGLLTALLTPTAKKASGLDLKQAKCTRSLFRTLSITP